MYNLDNDYFLNSLETFVIPSSEWYVMYLFNIYWLLISDIINVNTNEIYHNFLLFFISASNWTNSTSSSPSADYLQPKRQVNSIPSSRDSSDSSL